MAAATIVGLNTIKPVVQFQASLLRLWADNAELCARNHEKGLETFSSELEQQQHQRAA
jgi:hypothetical protein